MSIVQVLKLDGDTTRREFLVVLKEALSPRGIALHLYENTSRYMQEKAVTKAMREKLLTDFFRGIFAEVSGLKIPNLKNGNDMTLTRLAGRRIERTAPPR
jgi:hypothetical protein